MNYLLLLIPVLPLAFWAWVRFFSYLTSDEVAYIPGKDEPEA